VHGTFSRTDHIGHKTSLNKFKRTEIISSIFSDHNSVKLGIDFKRKTGKHTNMWRLNNMLLNKQWVNKEIKDKIKKKYLETNENGNKAFQNLWNAAQANVLRGKFTEIQASLKKQEKSQTI